MERLPVYNAFIHVNNSSFNLIQQSLEIKRMKDQLEAFDKGFMHLDV